MQLRKKRDIIIHRGARLVIVLATTVGLGVMPMVAVADPETGESPSQQELQRQSEQLEQRQW